MPPRATRRGTRWLRYATREYPGHLEAFLRGLQDDGVAAPICDCGWEGMAQRIVTAAGPVSAPMFAINVFLEVGLREAGGQLPPGAPALGRIRFERHHAEVPVPPVPLLAGVGKWPATKLGLLDDALRTLLPRWRAAHEAAFPGTSARAVLTRFADALGRVGDYYSGCMPGDALPLCVERLRETAGPCHLATQSTFPS